MDDSAQYVKYRWKRFWCPRDGRLPLSDHGFLIDPDEKSIFIDNGDVVDLEQPQELSSQCLILLGEPGIGKTTALRALAEKTRELLGNPSAVSEIDLGRMGDNRDLRDCVSDVLCRAVGGRGAPVYMFADALDECLIRLDLAHRTICEELAREHKSQVKIRIACRTALWRHSMENRLQEIFGRNEVRVLELAPLRLKDVKEALAVERVDEKAFLDAVYNLDCGAFASNPSTLRFLIASWHSSGSLPSSRANLFHLGLVRLCEETNINLLDSGNCGKTEPDQRLLIASRLAAVMAFCNRSSIRIFRTSSDTVVEPLQEVTLEEVRGGTEQGATRVDVTSESIREVLNTGLFTGRGTNLLGWAHRTYQEYLAAYYLIHHQCSKRQIFTLLTSPLDSEGRVVPQLHGVANWLSALNQDICEFLVERDVEILLGSEMLIANRALCTRAVRLLLERADQDGLERSLDDRQLMGLYFPGLVDLIRTYLSDSNTTVSGRRLAIRILATGTSTDVQDLLADTAIDVGQAVQVRVEAAFALSKVGDSKGRARLREILDGESMVRDLDDDLRGAVLMAVWPDIIKVGELVGYLTEPKMHNVWGLYRDFMVHRMCRQVSISDLCELLKSVPSWLDRGNDETTMEEAVDAVMSAAWQHFDVVEIQQPFVDAAFVRICNYQPVLTTNHTDKDRELLWQDSEKRLNLVLRLVRRFSHVHDGLYHLVVGRTPLLDRSDVDWCLAQILLQTEVDVKKILAELVRSLYSPDDTAVSGRLIEVAEAEPVLYAAMRYWLQTVELDAPEAKLARKHQRKRARLYIKSSRSKFESYQLVANIKRLLAACREDICSGYWLLTLDLFIDPKKGTREGLFSTEITRSPGWAIAPESVRASILSSAGRFLRECGPVVEQWIDENVVHYVPVAGYHALRLLRREALDTFDAIGADIWGKWAIAILAYPHNQSQEDRDEHISLVSTAYRKAGEAWLVALDKLVRRDSKFHDFEQTIWQTEGCWDSHVAERLRVLSFDQSIKSEIRLAIIKVLLSHNDENIVSCAVAYLSDDLGSDTEEVEFISGLIAYLVVIAPNESWTIAYRLIQTDDEIRKRFVGRLATASWHLRAGLFDSLSDEQSMQVFCWAADLLRIGTVEKAPGLAGDSQETNRLKENVLQHLAGSGTPSAVACLERLVDRYPGDVELSRWLASARRQLRAKSWSPPSPVQVLDMVRLSHGAVIRSGEELLELILEELHRLEEKLAGEDGCVALLWEGSARSLAMKPGDEDKLSRVISSHLRGLKSIVVNREVQIHLRDRPDIRIDAVADSPCSGERRVVSVIIELKGCWNEALTSSMKSQLVDRYLNSASLNYGIYLVGWYYCDAWKKKRGTLRRLDIGSARKYFEAQAKEVSCQGKLIKSFVLDVRLPQH